MTTGKDKRDWNSASREPGAEARSAAQQPAATADSGGRFGRQRAVIASQGERMERFLRSKLASPADAEDLAQEAYLRLLRVKEPQLIQDPVAYLFRIARNLLGEMYGTLPPPSDSVDELELADQHANVEAEAEHKQQMDRLEEALEHVHPKCRAAIVMQRRDGMTVDEIAVELNLSRGMVKKHLAQGLARCRARLRRYHEESFLSDNST